MTPPAAAAAAPARTVRPRRTAAPGRTFIPPARPRRVSGPARGLRDHRSPGAAQRERERQRGLAVALPAALRSLAGHRLLARLLAGKAWIAVVAFALIGIVTLQLTLLQLNTSIGRALVRENALQRENAALSIENSEMAAGDRVEASATQLGMEIVPAGALRFLGSRSSSDPARAARVLNTPVHPAGVSSESLGASASATSSASTTATAAGASSGASSTGEQGTPATTQPAQSGAASTAETPSGSAESSTASAAAPAASAPQQPAATPATSGGANTEPAHESSPAGGTGAGPAG